MAISREVRYDVTQFLPHQGGQNLKEETGGTTKKKRKNQGAESRIIFRPIRSEEKGEGGGDLADHVGNRLGDRRIA